MSAKSSRKEHVGKRSFPSMLGNVHKSTDENAHSRHIPYVGGQALIEGVMMKTPTEVSMAARTRKGIITKKEHHESITAKNKFLGLPVIRGFVFLIEMLVIGFKALTWSAEQQNPEEGKLGPWELAGTIVFAVVLTVGIFVVAPYYLAKIFIKQPDVWFNLLDGVFRLVLFLLYILVIGLMPDVRRTFQYHGAEHKAVFCYEAKLPLTVKNVQKFKTMHPRCGTSLLIFVIALSIVLFSFIRFPQWYFNIPLRIVIVPVIAGISYEILKLSARFKKNPLFWLIMQPGLWVQKITTKEPTNKQVEVAIAALKKVT